jgi:hypothetical protein
MEGGLGIRIWADSARQCCRSQVTRRQSWEPLKLGEREQAKSRANKFIARFREHFQHLGTIGGMHGV